MSSEKEEGRESAGNLSATLKKGLRVLALFDVMAPEWTFSEICRATKMPKATAFRLVKTLESQQYLSYDPQCGKYHLGTSMLRAAYLTFTHTQLVRLADPFLEKLAADTTETVNMTVMTDQGPMIVDTVLTSRPFKPYNPIGLLMPGMANVHSRVFAAFATEEERNAALAKPIERRTEFTIVDQERMAAELLKIRSQGFAYGLQEWNLGMSAVAAPVYDASGKVRACIALVVPSERSGSAKMEEYSREVRDTAERLSAALGHTRKA
jgi:DNA-binding IclR family transcriptional regulator